MPDIVLDHFAPPGIVDAADMEATTQRFKKALLERALGAELQHRLTQEAGAAAPDAPPNHRNGTSAKTVLTDTGTMPLAIPRHGTFAPVLIPTHARRFTGFDDKIIAPYARGLSVREIQAFLTEMYAVDVSPDLISPVTDAVLSEVTAWQARPLETMYPVVMFDALAAVYPATTLQTCTLAAALRPSYTAPSAEAAAAALDAFAAGPWGTPFPTVVAAWHRAWAQVIQFFAFPPEIRRVLYTTNALENVTGRCGRR